MKTAEEIISGKYKTFTLHLNGKNEKYMLYEDTLQAMESYRNQSSPMSEEEIREWYLHKSKLFPIYFDMPISPVFELLKEFQSHLLMDEIKRRKKIRKNFNH
jgi:hypothetical protein